MRSERNNKENQTAKVGVKRKGVGKKRGGKEKGLESRRGGKGRAFVANDSVCRGWMVNLEGANRFNCSFLEEEDWTRNTWWWKRGNSPISKVILDKGGKIAKVAKPFNWENWWKKERAEDYQGKRKKEIIRRLKISSEHYDWSVVL